MKELNWIQMSDYMHTLQEFTRLAVLKQTELTTASAGEMDLLSRIYLLKSPVTPLQLSQQMKMKKSSISRIIHHLLEKELIIKQKNELDGRSYHLIPVSYTHLEPVNGQDERRISCAAVDSPARLC